MNNVANFITVEGLEGVGKSSNIAFVENWLTNKGLSVKQTREPGGTPLAEDIRSMLLEHREEKVDELTELLLMFGARAQHVNQKIKPWLDAGHVVLSDRFTDATYAYQGGGRQLDWQKISQLESMVQENVAPQLTLLLDAPIEIGMARVNKRGASDRIEVENIEFFERCRAAYLRRAKDDSNRVKIIDASQSLKDVQTQIQAVLEAHFNE